MYFESILLRFTNVVLCMMKAICRAEIAQVYNL